MNLIVFSVDFKDSERGVLVRECGSRGSDEGSLQEPTIND